MKPLALCLLLAGHAAAADILLGVPAPVGAGPRALGMGDAFAAVADDATAHTWNPGGMVQLEQPEVSASAGWYRRDASVGDDDVSRHGIDLDHVAVALPSGVAGRQQVVGLTWQRRFDFIGRQSESHQEVGPIGTDDIASSQDSDGGIASIGAAYALEPINGLGLGVAFDAWDRRVTGRGTFDQTTTRNERLVSIFGTDDSTITTTREHYQVDEGYSASVGGWWQPCPWLNLALVAKPGYRLRMAVDRAQHLVSVDNINSTVTESDARESERFTLHYPPSYLAAVAVRAADVWTVALDVGWTQWSRYRTESRLGTHSPIASQHDPGDFPDGWTVRLGLEHLVLLERSVLALRIGGSFEQLPGVEEAADATDVAVAAAGTKHDNWTTAACGASVFIRRFSIDAAVEARFGDDVGTGRDAAATDSADVRAIIARVGTTWHLD